MKTTNALLALFVFAILAVSPLAYAEESTGLGETGNVVSEPQVTEEPTTTTEPTVVSEPAVDPVATTEPTETTAVDEPAIVTPTPEPEVPGISDEEATEIVAAAAEVPAEEVPTVTPAQPIRWGMKRSLERLEYLISIGKAAKAKKGLEHARERHLEVMKMIAQKKLDKAERAETARQELLARAKADISAVSEDDPEAESELTDELETEVEEQDTQATRFKANVHLRFKGELTAEEQAKIDAIVAALKESNNDVKVSIKEKRARTDVKIKVRTAEKSDKAEERKSETKQKIEERKDNMKDRVQAARDKASQRKASASAETEVEVETEE